MDYTVTIKGHELEYLDDDHIYLVDGVQLPSITQILSIRFGHRFDGVDPTVLNEAARKGTQVHEAIEKLCKTGMSEDLPEVRGFAFLRRMYGFHVLDNEVPVILIMDGEPIAAGRLDLVLERNGELGLADIKRTSKLDREYLAYQLNLYKMAYEYSYDAEIKFLRGIHLRDTVRKYVDIPINETMPMAMINEYLEMAK